MSPRSCSSSSRPSTMRLDAGPQRGDPRAAERGRGQPAQPGVVGRVDAEHVPGERGAGQALGDHRAVAGERGVHVLGQPRVVERGPGLGVSDDEPGPLPVGQRDLVHRPVGADLREQRERVVAVVVAPRVERRITHGRHLSHRSWFCDLAEAGTQQVDRGQPVACGLADQRLRAGPARWSLTQGEPVVHEQPVGHRLARRVHQLDGVEVGEPPGEAGDDGVAAVGLDRTAGQQRPQPDGVGQRGGQPPAVAAGDRRGDRGGPADRCCMTIPSARPPVEHGPWARGGRGWPAASVSR